MSRYRWVTTFLFCASLGAQTPQQQTNFALAGEIHGPAAARLNGLYVELYDAQHRSAAERTAVASDGSFRLRAVEAGWYTVRVVSEPGAEPLLEQYVDLNPASGPLLLRLPERASNQPVTGVVSLDELRHPIPRKAVRAAVEAQRFSTAHDTVHAIARLEEAIRIDPSFRAAHTNLGAQYARTGRYEEAMEQFRRALEIGPPDAIVLSNIAWIDCVERRYREAVEVAQRALALDPANEKAQMLLRFAKERSAR